MVTARKVINFIAAEPFRPFRITTTEGRTFDIRDPEMVHVGRSAMTIHMYFSDYPNEANNQDVEVALSLTESIEMLDPPHKQDAQRLTQ